MDTYPTFIGIFGEIKYYGGTWEEWLSYQLKNPFSILEDFRNDLRKRFLKKNGGAK